MAEENNKGFFKGLFRKLGFQETSPEEERPQPPASQEIPPETGLPGAVVPSHPEETAAPSGAESVVLSEEIPVARPASVTPPPLAAPAIEPPAAELPAVEPPRGLEMPADKPTEGKLSFFERLKRGLSKTHETIIGRVDTLLLGKKQIDADTLDELEEILITSDIGVKTTVDLIRTLEQRLKRNELQDGEAVKRALKEEILQRLLAQHSRLDVSGKNPFVILVIGVNGVGKTTTIGKLAAKYRAEGKKVLLAAGDTFRAAAAEQLELWANRVGAEIVRHKEGADPSAVVFDACKAALARSSDVLIIDTAGRMHTKVNLMEEMKKIRRVLTREIPEAPHETLLVLDAATGQNALSQAQLFKEAAQVSGVVLTKLDGSAKGGIVVAVSHEYTLPIRFIGVGETVEDLREFDPAQFVDALFE
ncbi:signal recognition particle-docking protein FtsY [Geomesophilobacter sediminis]|uniref:Signal recognition particle receptor FtsY n=1 Tax=Geomesophilobacter sediminis TaxID=2798584 RepID=A0A8J7IRV7_9BACT|nr:signal recognition particle-docking protein FtsY [Geomesophilobacter sediminis]MBJ6725824.1 signal recognition particle-docking protein FtsY [Geomesophilobacter sediminis]